MNTSPVSFPAASMFPWDIPMRLMRRFMTPFALEHVSPRI